MILKLKIILSTVINSSSLGAVETAKCFCICIWEVCIWSYWLQYLVIRLSIRGNNIVLYFCTSSIAVSSEGESEMGLRASSIIQLVPVPHIGIVTIHYVNC